MTSKTKRRLKEKKRLERARTEENARFHVSIGPSALFRRVGMVFAAPRRLGFSKHAREKIEERSDGKISDAALEEIRDFDPRTWNLISASCGPHGRFRETIWRVKCGGKAWMVVVGIHSQLVTAYPAGREGPRSRKYERKGSPFYNAVERMYAHFLERGIPPGGMDEDTPELQAQCEARFPHRKSGRNVRPRSVNKGAGSPSGGPVA